MELKPCPFCGGIGDLEMHSFYNERKKSFADHTYSVKCRSCRTQTYAFYGTTKAATEAWNRRSKQCLI